MPQEQDPEPPLDAQPATHVIDLTLERLARCGLGPQFCVSVLTEENVHRVGREPERPGQPIPPALGGLPEERLMLRVTGKPDDDQDLTRPGGCLSSTR